MKAIRTVLVILLVLALLALVWAPLLLGDTLGQSAETLPISQETQIVFSSIASVGVLVLFAILVLVRNRRR